MVVDVIKNDGLIYTFGRGHSHLPGLDAFYRAGGLANVSPILDTDLMLHNGVAKSSRMEKMSGIAPEILRRYCLTERDMLFVFSASGKNAVPVEMPESAVKPVYPPSVSAHPHTLSTVRGFIAPLIFINNEVPEEVNVKAVEIAKVNGVKMLYNPAPIRKICKYLLANTGIFTPNEHEAEALGDIDNVIITVSSRGCYVKCLDLLVPTLPISEVAETAGAGDTFSGALSVLIAEGAEIPDDCRGANAAALLEVTKKYVMPAIPKRCEVENLLAKF